MTEPLAQGNGLLLADSKSKTPFLLPQNAAGPGQVPQGQDAGFCQGRRRHVPRFRQSLRGVLCLAALAGPIAGCTMVHGPVPLPPQEPMHQVVSQEDSSFVIRVAAPVQMAQATQPQASITLGDSVRIDRRALVSTKTKDIPHGETR